VRAIRGLLRPRIRFNPENIQRAVARTVSRTLVWQDSNGNRNVPYLNWNGKRWNLNWNWLDNDLNQNGRLAVSSNWQRKM